MISMNWGEAGYQNCLDYTKMNEEMQAHKEEIYNINRCKIIQKYEEDYQIIDTRSSYGACYDIRSE